MAPSIPVPPRGRTLGILEGILRQPTAPFHEHRVRAELQKRLDAVRIPWHLDAAGNLVARYRPGKHCLELKSLKLYLLAYRNLGIFYENVVNRVLRDVVAAAKPGTCVVRGDFSNRGGLTASVEARYRVPAVSR